MHKFGILFGLLVVHSINGEQIYSQRELAVKIEPGAIDCFYEKAKPSQIIDIEYQVIDGGHGDLDISFELQNPNGHPIITEYKKSDNIHRIDVNVDGDYRFCFDNSFSSFNTKTVFFELVIEFDGENGEAPEDAWGKDVLDNTLPEQLLQERVQEIQESIFKLHNNLNTVQRALDVRRSSESRDRNQAEENNFKVGA